MKTVFGFSVVVAIPIAIVSAIYTLFDASISALLWCVFVGFTTTFALGPDVKKIPHFVFSQFAGWFWGIAYFYLASYLVTGFGLSFTLGLGISVLACTIALVYIHAKFLSNTVFGIIPMVFAAIFVFFATVGGINMNILYCAISITLGTILASIVTPIYNQIFEKSTQKN